MPTKDPTTWTLSLWALAVGMSCAGGIVNWYGRVKKGHARAFNFIELMGEIFTSAFVGLGSFMVAESLNQPIGLCAALAGVGGHMATRLLFSAEQFIERKMRSAIDATDYDVSDTIEGRKND